MKEVLMSHLHPACMVEHLAIGYPIPKMALQVDGQLRVLRERMDTLSELLDEIMLRQAQRVDQIDVQCALRGDRNDVFCWTARGTKLGTPKTSSRTWLLQQI